MRKRAEDVTTGDTVLRYGMWFVVESVEKLPAERGGHLYNLNLKPAPNRLPRSSPCSLALFPEETITIETRQIAGD